MDRTLIERMVGAVVLVLLLVLFAPALLDGQREDDADTSLNSATDGGMRTEVIVLNEPLSSSPMPNGPEDVSEDPLELPIEPRTNAAQAAKAASTEPVAAAKSPPKTQPIVKAEAEPKALPKTEPAAKPAAPPEPAKAAPVKVAKAAPVKKSVSPASKPEGFAVQLGSFSNRDNAEKYASAVRKDGFTVFLQRASTASGAVYRVHAGPRPTRADAEKLASVLAASGRGVLVVDLSAQK